MAINDSIFIPQNNFNDINVFGCSFFQKKQVIICPIKIRNNVFLKVSIQQREETLLLKDNKINSFNVYLSNNIVKIVALYISEPIQLKPRPTLYIGCTLVDYFDKIPNCLKIPYCLNIPKYESLDLVSPSLIQNEKKLWSDYIKLTKKKIEVNNIIQYKYSFRYIPNVSYLFFIFKKDLYNIDVINVTMNGCTILSISGLWLQTRYEEHDNNNNNNGSDNNNDNNNDNDNNNGSDNNNNNNDNNYILLPLSPIYNINIEWTEMLFFIQVKNLSIKPPVLFFKNKKDQENDFIPENPCNTGILQLTKYNINPNNPSIEDHYKHKRLSRLKSKLVNPLTDYSSIYIHCIGLLFGLWGVVTYKGNLCPASFPHPFFKLKFSINGVTLFEENGNYYSKIVPLFFEQQPAKKYLIYRIMFQNTPLSFSYPITKNPYKSSQFISNQSYYSTLNVSRCNNVKIDVYWDKEVIQQHYPEFDQLELLFFSENYNLLFSDRLVTRLHYST